MSYTVQVILVSIGVFVIVIGGLLAMFSRFYRRWNKERLLSEMVLVVKGKFWWYFCIAYST